MRAPLVAGLLLASGLALAASARWSGDAGTFRYPAGWRVEPAGDVAVDPLIAVRLVAPAKARIESVTVLVGRRPIAEGELDGRAAKWHRALLKNRVAWGMRSAGGLPRDLARVAGRRSLRYRDQVGTALGDDEQTLTCQVMDEHLACVLAVASPTARDRVDQATAQILGTLRLR